MYMAVSLKIEIDASISLRDMESQIQQAGRAVMWRRAQASLSPHRRAGEDLPALWKRANATAVVTLRVQRVNAEWEDAAA